MASTRTLLSIAPNLKLPEEAVTETFAILGKRGSGKTTTARVLTEELLHVGLPALILDPTGVWWGLRASADGDGDGYPVIIFGGDHADVPLEETSGRWSSSTVGPSKLKVYAASRAKERNAPAMTLKKKTTLPAVTGKQHQRQHQGGRDIRGGVDVRRRWPWFCFTDSI